MSGPALDPALTSRFSSKPYDAAMKLVGSIRSTDTDAATIAKKPFAIGALLGTGLLFIAEGIDNLGLSGFKSSAQIQDDLAHCTTITTEYKNHQLSQYNATSGLDEVRDFNALPLSSKVVAYVKIGAFYASRGLSTIIFTIISAALKLVGVAAAIAGGLALTAAAVAIAVPVAIVGGIGLGLVVGVKKLYESYTKLSAHQQRIVKAVLIAIVVALLIVGTNGLLGAAIGGFLTGSIPTGYAFVGVAAFAGIRNVFKHDKKDEGHPQHAAGVAPPRDVGQRREAFDTAETL